MTHKRQSIREAIAAQLQATPTLLGRVVKTRSRPTMPDELPLAIVYTLSESSDQATIAGDLTRTLSVMIEVRASSVGAMDDTLDALCAVVEQSMAADQTFGRLARNSFLSGTSIGLDGEGDSRQAVATLTYTVLYDTDAAGV